jgi:hypothetical protein
MLTDNGGRRWCLGGNQRGGGISSGGSQRCGRIGCGEGEELELRRGTEQSEASAASPNRWACKGEREREMGGGSRLGCATRRKGNGRERARGPGHGGRQRGAKDMAGNGSRPSGAGGGTVAQTRESGGAQPTRRCATDRWGRAATGPGGQRWGAGGRGVSEVAGRQQAGLVGTVPDGVVQTRF